MSSISIGQTYLHQFRIDAFIASGGMGAVYKVWDLKRNVPLAMKVLHSDLADDPSIFRRFKREANALKKLAHPNIVPFYGLYQTSEFAFLLERYVDGPSLKEILRDKHGKPMPVYEVLTYLKALSAALGYAHANGVIHCDVKPGNVMIDQGGNIFLTDFGIARHSESTTTTLATVGTAAYMAPEQIRGEAVSPATDIYALGVMLYEMLTGQRPFRGDEKGTESGGTTAGERIRFGHLTLLPPDPRLFNPALSNQVAQVLLRTLQKQPSQRYQNTNDLFVELCNAAGLNPDQLSDRISPLPRSKENLQRQDSGTSNNYRGQLSSVSAKVPIQEKRRLIPWLILGMAILMIGLLIIGFQVIGHTASDGHTKSQATPSVISSPVVYQIVPTATPPPTRTPPASPTNTPFIPPTFTPTPTPNSDQPWGKIVFSCRANGEMNPFQICMMNADGSGWRKMTFEDNYGHYYASPAPDGQSFVFAANMTGIAEIYEMDLNGRQTQLTNNLGPLSGPEISPDGRYIVFTKQYDDTHQGIWLMDRDGSNPHLLYQNPGVDAVDPTWSPDGSQIQFSYGSLENKHLMVMSRDGGSIRQVSQTFTTRGRSDRSSNGTTIVAYSNLPPDRELFTMNIDGTNLTQLTRGWSDPNLIYGNSQGPSFSPDGQWVTFTAYPDRDRVSESSPTCEIYIIRVDGTDVRRLTNNDYCDYQPRWGP